ncbi:MAG: hypothetical protein U9R42_08945 [Bacteroidota bacterium]|nr:hypothetical protein [Bacteroidota bacterium]
MRDLFKNERIRYLIILIIILLPLFVINVKDTHNWGDDFALYIHQTKNIVEGKSAQNTGLIFNEDNPGMISNVSIGFSLLLTPVYALFGNNILAFSYFITLFLFLVGILAYLFLSKRMHPLLALLFVLIMEYNRWTLFFKQNILSDIPFAFLLLFAILVFYSDWKIRYLKCIVIALLAGFAMTVRSIALVIPVAFFGFFIFEIIKDIYYKKFVFKKAFKEFLIASAVVIVAFALKIILRRIFFPLPIDSSYSSAYATYLSHHSIWEVIAATSSHYFFYFKSFFNMYRISDFIGNITIFLTWFLMAMGLVIKLLKKIEFHDFVFLAYFAVVLLYPATAGFRYIFPILPLLFYYQYVALKWMATSLKMKKLDTLAYIYVLFVVLQYYQGVLSFTREQKNEIRGPQSKTSVEVFDYIKNHTPDSSIIVFRKPRALALYTDRSALSNNRRQKDVDKLDTIYNKLKVNYLLQNNNEIPDTAMILYLKKYSFKYKLIYKNNDFKLYELRNILD